MPTLRLETRFDTPSAHESWNFSSNISYPTDSHHIGEQHNLALPNPYYLFQMKITMLPRCVLV